MGYSYKKGDYLLPPGQNRVFFFGDDFSSADEDVFGFFLMAVFLSSRGGRVTLVNTRSVYSVSLCRSRPLPVPPLPGGAPHLCCTGPFFPCFPAGPVDGDLLP